MFVKKFSGGNNLTLCVNESKTPTSSKSRNLATDDILQENYTDQSLDMKDGGGKERGISLHLQMNTVSCLHFF